MNRKLVTIKFGSYLYGTSTPASDLDFKAVHVPSIEDILLQRAKGSISTSRSKAFKEKNLPGEIEEESYSLQRFLQLVSEGQTVALDMLFAPAWSFTGTPAPEWQIITDNKRRLVTKKSAAFVGYCKKQAAKYGIKGSRVAATRSALALLKQLVDDHGSAPKLGQFASQIAAAARIEPINMGLMDIPHPHANGEHNVIRHWDVCGRKLPFPSSIKNARDVIQRLVDEYGQRALQAESNQGVDWKALSHAVRVGHQALELLHTGHITFPLPNAAHVLAIKIGGLSYQEVSAEIEQLLVEVEAAAVTSSLPSDPDHAWIEQFVVDTYRAEICRQS